MRRANTLITSSEQLTPEYLTDVLRGSGYLDRGKVAGITNKLTKTLQVSVVSRLEVAYSADAPATAPSKLFLKVSLPNSSKIGDSGHSKEVEFYNLVASEMMDPPFIRCFHAEISPDSGDYFLLLEDLSETHSQPKSPLPPSDSQSLAADECLAALHAFWWEHPQLGKRIGKLFSESDLTEFCDALEKNVIAFIDFLGDRLSEKQRKMYDLMLASKAKIWGRLTNSRGLTVTHGDTHWWNFLYPVKVDTDRVRLFDWQLWHIDLGARDLAFLVSLGGFSERRTSLEPDLLRCYYDTLSSRGVRNYSWDEFLSDYTISAVRNLNIPVIQWSRGTNEKAWTENLERATVAFEELGCSELL